MDPFSIAISTITILDTLGTAFRKIKEIKDLPNAIQKVGESLPIVLEIVELARDETKKGHTKETIKASIAKLLENCKKNVEKLQDIFGEIRMEQQRSENEEWSTLVKFYREKVRPLGKAGKVEALMERVLNDLKLLATHHIFKGNAESRKEVEKLNEAIKALAEVEPSLPDSDFNDNAAPGMFISGNGKGIQSTGAHAQNTMGDSYTHTGSGGMNIGQQSDFSLKDWLKCASEPIDFEKIQREKYLIAQSAPYSGRWFLESREFKRWESLKTRTLWCYGNVGTGKTVLSSIIVNHLANRYLVNPGIACIYVFFDHEHQDVQDLSKVLANLLIQLYRRRGERFERTEEPLLHLTDQRLNIGDEGLVQMLEELINKFANVFLIVDALDECTDILASHFMKICKNLPEKVRMLVTSHPGHLERIIAPEKKVEIKTNENDVKSYLRQFIDSRPVLREIVEQGESKTPGFLENTLQELVTKSQGVFLLAHLYIESISATVHSLDELNYQITTQRIPSTSDKVYEKAMRRIRHNTFWKDTANRALSWVLLAERPMTIEEFSHAVAISDAAAGPDSEKRPLPRASDIGYTGEAIIASCAGIVTAALDDSGRNIVRFAHITAQRYLKEKQPPFLHGAQSMMAEACLSCLASVPLVEDKSQVKDDCEYPFLDYSANNWGHHLLKLPRDEAGLYRLAWDYLANRRRLNCMVRLIQGCSQESDISPLHMAAYFGLESLIRRAFDVRKPLDVNALTARRETPLHWAVTNEKHDFMVMLIEKGADINTINGEKRTALHKAIMINDQMAIESLLQSGRAYLEHCDSAEYTCLRWAARYGPADTVIKLLHHGACVNSSDRDGYTALRWAAIRGHIPIIKILVCNGAIETGKWQLLSWAAKEGQKDVIQFLAQRGVDVNAFDNDGLTALNLAIDCNHAMASWILIQNRAEVNKLDKKGRRPLHASVEICCTSSGVSNKISLNILWLLLENNADVNGKTDNGGRTPLHLACAGGNTSAIRILLQYDADPRQVDKSGRTPLHSACAGEGASTTISVLLQHEPDLVGQGDKTGRTPLHVACFSGNEDAVRVLLRHGADPKQADGANRTPLHHAVSGEHKAIISILLQRARELVHVADEEGRTPLHDAASQGNIILVETLLDYGAYINAECNEQKTPLYLAMKQQHKDVEICLLNRGAKTPGADIEL